MYSDIARDRDTKFTKEFASILGDSGCQCHKLPVRSPNLNAYAERFVLSIKSECLNRMIFFGESSRRRAISEYMEHYHHERTHQGLSNELIESQCDVTGRGAVRCSERLGGMLKFYFRAA